ncbi:hypothetical protein [Enterococcus xiangfangensis]|uniref:Uncharacterized protein n=1 Tax=Enterococcus xiangfangensis TaxID=1296537 RepID=A0ABU3F8Z0_9ENTE|nr:hypothetical protein [Enterococcus xiangfangensis]MBM7711010.1 hypothetical protein [Enterococcus xiangfangensis]MDT2758950.1 hypothetical protein [Enterococcus xiangfangensis]NBK07813.1 hypothetical protein [Enterococcus asini]
MFEPTKTRRSDVPFSLVPEHMQQEIWHMIFMRPIKGLNLTSPQRFHFFKNKIAHTLSIVYSQSEPYFSDGITAPYVQDYEEVEFPRVMYVYDVGNELIMTLDEKNV